jgi:molybdopterin-guanine dinucleotide biosynthesis protein A
VNPHPAPVITGVILAGGRGTRMGGLDKGWIEFDGRPLVQLVLDRFRPQVDEVLISANRNLERYRALGVTVVPDLPEWGAFAGPLAGIHAAMRVARGTWLAVVTCDAPKLPADLVARLRGRSGERGAAVAHAGGRMQPLHCLVHRDLAATIAGFLAQGEYKVERWLEAIGAESVAFEDPDQFLNVNVPADVSAGTR